MADQLPSPDEPLRQQAAKPWRVLIILGASVVILAFLMAGYIACTDPRAIVDVVAVFLLIALGPSLFLLGLIGVTIGGLTGKRTWIDVYIWAMTVLVFGCGVGLCGLGVSSALATTGRFGWRGAVPGLLMCLTGAVALAVLHQIWSRVPPPRRVSQIAFWSSLLIAAVASLLAAVVPWVPSARVMWVTGSTLLLLGCVGEAGALTRRPWWDVLWRLPLCRLTDAPAESGTCPGCGYNLYGLTEQRCPECGRAFTFAEIGATPAEMGFGASKDEPGQE